MFEFWFWHVDKVELLNFCVLVGRRQKLERRDYQNYYLKNLSFLDVCL